MGGDGASRGGLVWVAAGPGCDQSLLKLLLPCECGAVPLVLASQACLSAHLILFLAESGSLSSASLRWRLSILGPKTLITKSLDFLEARCLEDKSNRTHSEGFATQGFFIEPVRIIAIAKA